MIDFVTYTMQEYTVNWHHALLCKYLDAFVKKEIKNLMVFMPPQHGKSELVSRRLPAFLLGKNPSLKIIGASYSADLSRQFNRSVQRIIDDKPYQNVFPDTQLNQKNVVSNARDSVLRNADIFETIKYKGFYKCVGVGGSLTGTPADIAIIDDPVKDAIEATSQTYQARTWEWYTDVLKTRLHNNSQILLTMTRWDEYDLAGRILKKEKGWEVLKLEGVKRHENHSDDPRKTGEPLWGERHSLERLLEVEQTSERTFLSLYQQDPQPNAAGLVITNWQKISRQEFNKVKGKTVYGLDFGFSSDPLALVEVTVNGWDVYVRTLVYKTNLLIKDFCNIAHLEMQSRKAYIYADSSRPESIKEININGYNCHPVKKFAGSIENRVSYAKQYTLHILEGDPLIDEIIRIRYKVDKDGMPLHEIEDGDDHAFDAYTYALTDHFQKKNTNMKVGFAKSSIR
jgi:hypothetical protein